MKNKIPEKLAITIFFLVVILIVLPFNSIKSKADVRIV